MCFFVAFIAYIFNINDMEAFARAPETLPDKQPMDKTWRMWKQQFEIFLKAAKLEETSSKAKANLLLNTVGKLGIQAIQEFPDVDLENYEVVLRKFDQIFDPPKKEIKERYKFYTRSKKNNEPIEAFISDLREKAKTCNFGHLTESLIRDMVLLDLKDEHLKALLLAEKNLDLNQLILLYKKYEVQTEKMKELSKNTQPDTSNNKSPKVCWRCATSHPPRNCPAFNVTCEKCHEKGHFTQQCGNKARANNNPNNLNVNRNIHKNKNISKNPFHQIEKNKLN